MVAHRRTSPFSFPPFPSALFNISISAPKSLASLNSLTLSLSLSLSGHLTSPIFLSVKIRSHIYVLCSNWMAPSGKTSNGRSPLVNQQHQITAYFCKKLDSLPSASNSLSPALSKLNPNPKASPSRRQVTPFPLQSKRKPVLVISPNTSTSSIEKHCSDKKSYGAEVVDRRVKVYCPLDMSWNEGLVKCFDKISGKHLVQYDDAEEEMLNLLEENIEWIEERPKKQLRRLRRISLHEDADLKELDGEDSLEDLEAEKDKCGRAGVGEKMSSRKRRVIERQKGVSVVSKKGKIGGVE